MAARVLGNSTKREGSTSIRAQGGLPVVEEQYQYIVVADRVDEPYESIREASGLPQIGSQFSNYLTCVGIDCQRRPNAAKYWDVTVTLSTQVEEGQDFPGGFNPKQDPTAWLPIRETKLERLQEARVKTRDNKAIANSAGQPFETGLLSVRYIPIWEFYQFEAASVTDEDIADRCETINDKQFKGRAKNTLLLNVESSVVGYYYGRRLRLTFYSLKYNRENWKHKRLNAGTYYLSAAFGTTPEPSRLPFKDSQGEAVHLGLLTEDGQKLGVNDDPTYVEFDVYEELDFSTFLRI